MFLVKSEMMIHAYNIQSCLSKYNKIHAYNLCKHFHYKVKKDC